MAENRLTERHLRSAVPLENVEGYLPDGGGLTARVMPARPGVDKKIVFQYRFKIAGKSDTFHCGTYPQTSLADARAQRNDARRLVNAGINPGAQKQLERKKLVEAEQAEMREQTVEQMFETWARFYLAKHRKDGGAMVRQFIESDVIPQIGKMRAKDVTKRHLVTLVIEPILMRASNRKANAVLSLLKQMFGDGAARGTIDADPTQGLTRAQAGGEEKARTRNLTEAEISELAVALTATRIPERIIAMIWLLLATGARADEMTGAPWAEFDLDARIWNLPANRNKSKRDHVIHVSEFAYGWLEKLSKKKEGKFLFAGRKADSALSEKWISKCVKDRQRATPLKNRSSQTSALILEGGTWTPHDLRRTLASRMGDLKVAPHVIEKCLNHSLGGILAVYQHQEYLSERKAAFDAWGARLAILSKPKSESAVIAKANFPSRKKKVTQASPDV